MFRFWITFLRDDSGATSAEYAILAAGIAVAVLGAVTLFGFAVRDLFITAEGAFPGAS